MDVIHRRVAGLDVHKQTVVACARTMKGRRVARECETFATTTDGLVALLQWLTAHRCTHVAMEATGVYWMPVWKILSDGAFTLTLANAAQVKAVPGRKTDVNDATWLADLLAHGLIRGSFVPDAPTQELRDLLRTRKQFVRERSSHIQRLQKTLEDANIKLDSVLTDILGRSGRAMIEALIAGEHDPEQLVALADRRLKASRGEVREALRGRVTPHHRFLLRLYLEHIDAHTAALAAIDQEVEGHLAPFRHALELLTTIPGVGELAAAVIISEIGLDMRRFPTVGHLLSWAGLCPKNDESAGKRRSTQLRPGNGWLKPTLVQGAWAAVRQKGSYLQAQFWRLRARRGPKKAICAVAASMLTAAYHMLQDGTLYRDLGAAFFDRRTKPAQTRRLVTRLQGLGYDVHLTPIPAEHAVVSF